MALSTLDVIKIFSEATSGPLSSGPSTAGEPTDVSQSPPKKLDETKMKNLVQDAVKNIGVKLNIDPNQVPDFSTKFQVEIQKELSELQDKAKLEQQTSAIFNK